MMEYFTTDGLDLSSCDDEKSRSNRAALRGTRKLADLKRRLEHAKNEAADAVAIARIDAQQVRGIPSRKQVKSQAMERGKYSLTLVIAKRHLRAYRRWCERTEFQYCPPSQELGEMLYFAIRKSPKVALLRRELWACIIDKPIASVLGENGTSIAGPVSPTVVINDKVRDNPRFTNPCKRFRIKPDGRELLRQEAEERRDNAVTSVIGGLDRRPIFDKARGTVKGHAMTIEKDRSGTYLAYEAEDSRWKYRQEVELPKPSQRKKVSFDRFRVLPLPGETGFSSNPLD